MGKVSNGTKTLSCTQLHISRNICGPPTKFGQDQPGISKAKWGDRDRNTTHPHKPHFLRKLGQKHTEKMYLLEHFSTILYKLSLKLWVCTIFAKLILTNSVSMKKRVEIFWGKLTGKPNHSFINHGIMEEFKYLT